MTNCPNCGAVREPAENRCPYCGTPYQNDKMVAEPVTIHMDHESLSICARMLDMGLITTNEARRRMGLL